MATSYRNQFFPQGIGALPEVFDSGRGTGFDYYIIRSDGVATVTIDNVVGGGTSRVTWDDGNGHTGVDFYYPSGDLMMSSYSTNGGQPVYSTFPDANGNSSAPIDDGSGRIRVENTLTSSQVGQGAVSSESWYEVNGASGSTVTYADGSQTRTVHIMNERWTYERDGSSTRTEIYGRGVGEGRYVEILTAERDPSGRLIGQTWSRVSEYTPSLNATGTIVHGADGSRTETVTRGGVLSSVQRLDPQGNVTETSYRADGSIRVESHANTDGTRGHKEYLQGGGFTSYDFRSDGAYLLTQDNGQGSVTSQWYTADNQPFDPEGATGSLADRQVGVLVNALAVFAPAGSTESLVNPAVQEPLSLIGATSG